ncbi:MAG: dTDP-4-dehydrorhamnose 3,5-epimerase [Candidimonas sp.]|nr:MAG: dTDP-4-dehydrorhamnose 3,5-epimerase [Candidimonas sp.]TAM19457.1 MAG: dTDP-4-dehydrorhamnose 3,5-epimerase [Candidimonas sp.]TAM75370.1 MAG: dTDP-4-dehydrorhamnose 3,5-epimerase [Candidimonas sp.]
MKVLDTRLPGVKRIQPAMHADERGYFLESFQANRYQELLGLAQPFVQSNCSHSKYAVLRGLHFQVQHPQGKLLHVTRGEIFDVVVDLRGASSTFGQWEGITLSGRSQEQLWIPPGLAHGFVVLSEEADVAYQCTDYYQPGDEACLRWDDPSLAIAWPIAKPLISAKDQYGLSLEALQAAGRLPFAPCRP